MKNKFKSLSKLISILNQLGNTTEQNDSSLVTKAVNEISGLIKKQCEEKCLKDLKVFKPSWRESLAKYLENYLKNPRNKTKFDGKKETEKVTELIKAGFEWIKSYCEDCFTKPQLC